MGKFPSDVSGPTLTQQSAKDETDINVIVARAKVGQDLRHVNDRPAMYGSLIGLPSYAESLNMVTRARDLFMQLDPFVRERFGNDPGRLLDFVANGANREEAIKLGLIEAPKPPVVDEQLETLRSIDEGLKARSGAKSSKPKAVDE